MIPPTRAPPSEPTTAAVTASTTPRLLIYCELAQRSIKLASSMTVSGDAVLAVVGTLSGTALGLLGTLLVWHLRRQAEKADRAENFQRENLLALQDLLEEYYGAVVKWINAGRPAVESEPDRLKLSLLTRRSRVTDTELRARIDALVGANAPATQTDQKALVLAYVGPAKPVHDRIDELLQA